MSDRGLDLVMQGYESGHPVEQGLGPLSGGVTPPGGATGSGLGLVMQGYGSGNPVEQGYGTSASAQGRGPAGEARKLYTDPVALTPRVMPIVSVFAGDLAELTVQLVCDSGTAQFAAAPTVQVFDSLGEIVSGYETPVSCDAYYAPGDSVISAMALLDTTGLASDIYLAIFRSSVVKSDGFTVRPATTARLRVTNVT